MTVILSAAALEALADALREVGEWGTVELVVERGRVAYVCPKRSVRVIDIRQGVLPMT